MERGWKRTARQIIALFGAILGMSILTRDVLQSADAGGAFFVTLLVLVLGRALWGGFRSVTARA